MSTCIAAGPVPGVARTSEGAAGRAASAWRPEGGECGTVVLADADEDSRAVHGILLRNAGFVVLEAATGEEAIRLAHARRPDAIVLAAVLRGVDAMRTRIVLGDHPATAAIPVVLLGPGGTEERERPARAARRPVPCPPLRLLDTLHAITERRQAA